MSLRLTAGAPARPVAARQGGKQPSHQPVLLSTLGSAYLAGRYAWRLARVIRRDLGDVRDRIARLSEKLARQDLDHHPKREAAVERLMAMCRWVHEEEDRAAELESMSALRRGQMMQVWSRLSPEAAADVERIWGTQARTPEQFLAWVDRMWEAETGQLTEGLECPF